MQELVGRLTALDAEATETLKVISYFDALIDGRASVDVLLRGAAVLSGCAAGFCAEGRTHRVASSGIRSPGLPGAPDPDGGWPSHRFGDDGVAWIEREGPTHANDDMILERLAIALAIAVDRTSHSAASRRAIETLIDPDASEEARIGAAKRLHLDVTGSYRVIASPASVGRKQPSVVIGTPAGAVRVSLGTRADAEDLERAGVGVAAQADALHSSWASALVAVRLTSARSPVLEADDLGGLLLLAAAADSIPPAPDALAVGALLRTSRRRCIFSTRSSRTTACGPSPANSDCTTRPCRPRRRTSPRPWDSTSIHRADGCASPWRSPCTASPPRASTDSRSSASRVRSRARPDARGPVAARQRGLRVKT